MMQGQQGGFFDNSKRGRGRAKHSILKRYLDAWLPILGQSSYPKWDRIVYIDGFAGPGTYRPAGSYEDEEGSPIVAYNSAADHNLLYRFHSQVHLIFIERDLGRAQKLEMTLRNLQQTKTMNVQLKGGFFSRLGTGWDIIREYGFEIQFEVRCQEFADALENILHDELYKFMPMLVFADPFGTKEIPMETFKKLILRPASQGIHIPTELFVLVMDSFVTRFKSDPNKWANITQLMGSDNWKYLDENRVDSTPEKRRDDFIQLYIYNIKEKASMGQSKPIVLKFEMKSKCNIHVYHLVFVTFHIAGLRQMKTAMWKATSDPKALYFSEWIENKRPSNEILADKHSDVIVGDLVQLILQKFYGHTYVEWRSIDFFILTETPYMPMKRKVKQKLKCFEINGTGGIGRDPSYHFPK